MIVDRCGDMLALVHQPSFEDDPRGFMARLEAHWDANVRATRSGLAAVV